LLSGRPPFKGRSKQEIFKSILSGDLSFDHPIWDKISPEAKDFINKALAKDTNKRADTKTLLDHPWLFRQINEINVKDQVQLEVANNLTEFRVRCFILNLNRMPLCFRVECFHAW
jgi:serine/threonine protein kinase